MNIGPKLVHLELLMYQELLMKRTEETFFLMQLLREYNAGLEPLTTILSARGSTQSKKEACT